MLNHETIAHRARRGRLSSWAYRLRYLRGLDDARQRAVVHIPEGTLILIVDGLWSRFQGKKWITYLLAVRSVHSPRAVLLPPVFLPGGEGVGKWQRIFDTLPPSVAQRIAVLVCDGLSGMPRLARAHGWQLQRCHFHFLVVLRRFRGQVNRNVGVKNLREDVYHSICRALRLPYGPAYDVLVQHIRQLLTSPDCPKWVRWHGRDFLRHREEFRTYLRYPEYAVPATTSAMEYYCGRLRDLLRRSHGFRTTGSFQRWISAHVLLHREITCNGRLQPK